MMRKASEVCVVINEAINTGRKVYITDTVETRSVIRAEFVPGLKTLSVLLDAGNKETKWWEVAVTWPFDELDGYALGELDGTFYVAPEWWFDKSEIL